MTNPEHLLKRDIGLIAASLLVLNGLIGSGIFALPGAVAVSAGLFSPWLFLIVGALFLTVVLTFAELASYYKTTGGPILYARDAFGPLAGFGTGWAIYLSRVTAFAANANVFATYFSQFHESLTDPTIHKLLIAAITIGLTWANYVGVKDGVRTMAVFSVLKLLPLLLLILLGVQEVTGATLIPRAPFEIQELGATTLLLIYAYVGFETVAVTAGETSNPTRNLPRALVGTMIATGLLYFFIVLVFISVIPADDYEGSTLVDVGRALAGPTGALVITLTAIFSIGGNLAGSMLAAPRLVFAMAEQKTLPAVFARVHSKYRTPHISIVATGALALLLGVTGSFVKLAIASSVIRLLGYIICIAALPSIRRQADETARAEAFHLKGGYLVPGVALIICFWLLAQSQAESWTVVGMLLGVGAILYIIETVFLADKSVGDEQ